MTTEEYLQEWAESASMAATTMQYITTRLEHMALFGSTTLKAFQELMKTARDEGLEGFFDNHPLNIDMLYYVLVEGMSYNEAYQESIIASGRILTEPY